MPKRARTKPKQSKRGAKPRAGARKRPAAKAVKRAKVKRAAPRGKRSAKRPAPKGKGKARADIPTLRTPPSSLDLDRAASAARTGRRTMDENRRRHSKFAALTAGDVDADMESAYFTGDEAAGGRQPDARSERRR